MKYKRYFQSYVEALWGLLFPSQACCIICQGPIEKAAPYGICSSCQCQLTFVNQGRWVQSAVVYGEESMRMFSALEYRGDIIKLIFRLKYQHQTYLARVFGKFMADHIQREQVNIDLVVPVPLYKERLSQRGFNQAALLSKYIALECQCNVACHNLVRTRSTQVMHHLSKQERRKNVKDAFALRNPQGLTGLNILLVDDILTTGSTVEACGKLLLEAGAKSVTVLTLARSLKKNL